jgi:hypothetical protein
MQRSVAPEQPAVTLSRGCLATAGAGVVAVATVAQELPGVLFEFLLTLARRADGGAGGVARRERSERRVWRSVDGGGWGRRSGGAARYPFWEADGDDVVG